MNEKVKKIRLGLDVYGVSHFSYYLSFGIYGAILSFIVSLLLIGISYCFKF
jgi:hypothetical protein